MAKLLSIAKRNGESIYIAGEPEEIVKANQMRNALEGFARRHRISIAFATELLGDKILELMELTAGVEPMVLSTLAKRLEPEVEGQVSISLLRAWKKFGRDCRRVQACLQVEPNLELAVECWCNQYGWLACTRFCRHRVRCFDGIGGESWKGGSLHASSSLRRCG